MLPNRSLLFAADATNSGNISTPLDIGGVLGRVESGQGLAALSGCQVLSVGRFVFFLPVGGVILAQPIGKLGDFLSKTAD